MNKLSTENLRLLPIPNELKRVCKAIYALEAIICPDWEYRYYSYQKDWSETEEFCEMRNGQGDQVLISFSEVGTCINGFAHESKLNGWKNVPVGQKHSFVQKVFGSKKVTQAELSQEVPNGILEDLPKVFNEFIFGEPVKSIGTTFCIWQTKTDSNWKIGNIKLPEDEYKDGSSDLLQLLDGNPLTYKNWAKEYYEENFDEYELRLELIERVFKGTAITKNLVKDINPKLEDFEKLKADLDDVGYEHKL